MIKEQQINTRYLVNESQGAAGQISRFTIPLETAKPQQYVWKYRTPSNCILTASDLRDVANILDARNVLENQNRGVAKSDH